MIINLSTIWVTLNLVTYCYFTESSHLTLSQSWRIMWWCVNITLRANEFNTMTADALALLIGKSSVSMLLNMDGGCRSPCIRQGRISSPSHFGARNRDIWKGQVIESPIQESRSHMRQTGVKNMIGTYIWCWITNQTQFVKRRGNSRFWNNMGYAFRSHNLQIFKAYRTFADMTNQHADYDEPPHGWGRFISFT